MAPRRLKIIGGFRSDLEVAHCRDGPEVRAVDATKGGDGGMSGMSSHHNLPRRDGL
jgi:hypothetical protein